MAGRLRVSCNEVLSGSRFRITARAFASLGFRFGVAACPAKVATCHTGNYMVDSFHSTSWVRLSWRTGWHG